MKPYALPLALWVSALVGLVMMLVWDSTVGDNVGLLLLCLPLATIARHAALRI